jgi:hypothetical protein
VLRDYVTDHLHFILGMHARVAFHRAIASELKEAMERAGTREIVDLCSGAGGPLLAVQKLLRSEMAFPSEVTLTDLNPNESFFREMESAGDGVQARLDPIDALNVPDELRGFRTLFASFHHFRPAAARRILEDAVSKKTGVAVFEWPERTPLFVAVMGLICIAQALVFTPWVRNLSVARLLLTYVLPLGPLVMAWDGTVSVLRTYTVQELREMTKGLDADYAWDIQSIVVKTPLGPMSTTFLIGVPTRPS